MRTIALEDDALPGLPGSGEDGPWREEHFSVLTDCPRADFSLRLQTVEEEGFSLPTIGGRVWEGV